MAAGTHLCVGAGCCRLSGGVQRGHWRRSLTDAPGVCRRAAGLKGRVREPALHVALETKLPLIGRREGAESRRPVLPTWPRRPTHTSQSSRVPEVRSNQLNRLTQLTERTFQSLLVRRLNMISAKTAEREKSRNYFTESPLHKASDCGSLLCLIQVPASEIAALIKVRAFSYGRRYMSRVFLPKFARRFRWYDHLKQFPCQSSTGATRFKTCFRKETPIF